MRAKRRSTSETFSDAIAITSDASHYTRRSLSRCYTSLPFDRHEIEFNMKSALEYAERDVQLSEVDGDEYPAQLGSARAQLANCLRKMEEVVTASGMYKVAIQVRGCELRSL